MTAMPRGFILFAVASIGVLLGPPSFAQNCQVTDLTSPLVAGRAKQIRFPDGHDVIIVGRNHGDRGNTVKFMRLLAQRSRSLSNADFIAGLTALKTDIGRPHPIGVIKSALEDSKNDFLFLTELLKNRPDLNMIADECTMQTCYSNAEYLPELYQKYVRELKRRKIRFSADHEDVFRAVMGMVGPYVAIRNPALMRTKAIIGLEGVEEVAKEEAADKKCGDMRGRTELLIGDPDSPFAENITDILDSLTLQGQVDFSEVAEKVRKAYHETAPPHLLQSLLDQFNACLDYKMATLDRDRFVAQGLANAGHPVIEFVGFMHLNSTAQFTAELCRSSGVASYTAYHSRAQP